MKKYALWNNKGGVGKTFLTFVTSTEYARIHADENIFVIDMCPQANVSEFLLGGSNSGGQELEKLFNPTPRRTIGGYFDTRIDQPHVATGKELDFIVHLKPINKELPNNLYLIAGDPSLELQAQAINQIAAQSLPMGAWENVHKWVLDLINAISKEYKNPVFFIDCNPSFSAYTELAIVAADKLIVPCTADGSSARAINNIGQLLYGIGVPATYQGANFAAKAAAAKLALPTLAAVPLNRSTQFDKKAAQAFSAMYDEIKKRVKDLIAKDPNIGPNNNSIFIDVPDAHSVSIVCSHRGLPLDSLKIKKYNVGGKMTQVNADPLKRYKTAASKLVALL